MVDNSNIKLLRVIPENRALCQKLYLRVFILVHIWVFLLMCGPKTTRRLNTFNAIKWNNFVAEKKGRLIIAERHWNNREEQSKVHN